MKKKYIEQTKRIQINNYLSSIMFFAGKMQEYAFAKVEWTPEHIANLKRIDNELNEMLEEIENL
jgi:hypothetical protein